MIVQATVKQGDGQVRQSLPDDAVLECWRRSGDWVESRKHPTLGHRRWK